MSREQRRAALNEIVSAYEREGFDPSRIVTVFGLVRALVTVLENQSNPQRMSDAGAIMMKVYDDTARKYGRPGELACKKGCGYCCHTRVTVTAPEIFHLARGVRPRWEDAGDSLKADFQKQEAVTRGLSLEERYATRTACPLLEEGSCGMYAPRPLTCRAYGSRSLDACITLYNTTVNNVPQSDLSQLMRAVIFAGLKAALKRCGLDGQGYELGHALDVALTPDAEARWLAGEAIFADVSQESRAAERSEGHQAFDLLVEVFCKAAFAEDVPPNPYFTWPH
jgi:Fe-S-cluster containining protein